MIPFNYSINFIQNSYDIIFYKKYCHFSAYKLGKGFAAGASVLGIGALCYYGAGLSSSTGAIDHAA